MLGHEGCGIVESVGAGVTTVQPGDRCVFILRPNCGRCDYCTVGRPMLCDGHTNPDGTMFDGTTRIRRLNGDLVHHYGRISCFAEHAVMPEEQLLVCGNDIPADRAALVGCAVITGFGAVMNTARIELGTDVAVIGCGGIGLNVIQAARMLGARRIVAVDVDERHLGFARDFGATDAVDARAGDPVAAIREITGGGAHYAFDAYGSPRTMEQAFAAIRAGGTAVQIGLSAEGETGSISPFELALSEKTLKGSFMGSSRPRVDMPRLLDLYRLGRARPRPARHPHLPAGRDQRGLRRPAARRARPRRHHDVRRAPDGGTERGQRHRRRPGADGAAHMRAEAARMGLALSGCVTDRGGHVVASLRMDGAPLGALPIAADKAYTSALWGMRTSEASEASLPGNGDWGFATTLGGRMIVFAGGVPIFPTASRSAPSASRAARPRRTSGARSPRSRRPGSADRLTRSGAGNPADSAEICLCRRRNRRRAITRLSPGTRPPRGPHAAPPSR